MKVLVVDDSRMVRRLIGGAAEVLGYEVIEAGNSRVALEMLEHEANEIAAITLDINMPEMNGLECLQALKANERFAQIPVIMVTSESEKRMILEAIRQGARHYITKPFTPDEVTKCLLDVIGDDDDF